jgi:hypothetical protein
MAIRCRYCHRWRTYLRFGSSSQFAWVARCGLSGAPTAGHQARAGGTRYIFTGPGLAPCRRRPLSSNVRPRIRPGSVLMPFHGESHLKSVHSILWLLVLAGCAATDERSTTLAKPTSEDTVCTKRAITGSQLFETICVTKEEAEERARQDQKTIKDGFRRQQQPASRQ